LSGQPFGLTTDEIGKVYVGSGAVYKLHGTTGAIIAVFTEGLVVAGGVAVDNNFVYVSDQGKQAIIKLTVFGEFVTSFTTETDPKSVALDQSGNIYYSQDGSVVKLSATGQFLQRFTTSPPLTFLRDVAVDQYGNVFVCDESSGRVLQFNNAGTVTHIYNAGGVVVHSVTLEKGTGNLFVTVNDQIWIFAPVNILPSTCTTGAAAGNYNLALIIPDGSDVQGLNKDRTNLYFWNVCGQVQFSECVKYAPNSTVCGLNLPITNGVSVARPTPPIQWEIGNSSSATVVGTVINGDECGRFGLPSQLIVALTCAKVQDNSFAMDDKCLHPYRPVYFC
jgi:hypothetical protein